MRSRPVIGTAGLVVVALLAACGDDGSDRLSTADQAMEIAIVSGGDADHDAMVTDDHDAMVTDDHDAMADDHDAMVTDDHDAMAADDHDAMVTDDHDAMTDDHDAMADDHDAMVTDDHDAMTDDHDAMVTDDHEDVDAASSAGVVVNVEMIEFGFVADTSSIPVGQPVTFRFQNTGVVPHEAMFGSIHQQEEFAQQTDHGDGHGSASHHGDVAAITLDAGETGEITLEFASPGEIWMGCHLPGHYAAGMIATLAVV